MNLQEKKKKAWSAFITLLVLTGWLMLAISMVELYSYQRVYLPTVWGSLSFTEQSLANINLELLDFRVIAIVCLVAWLMFKINREVD